MALGSACNLWDSTTYLRLGNNDLRLTVVIRFS